MHQYFTFGGSFKHVVHVKIIENPAFDSFRIPPLAWAAINVAFSLVGILFLGWSLAALVYLFWIEVFLTLSVALVQAVFAMDGKPFLATIGSKIFSLVIGGFFSIAFFMLMVTFTFDAFYSEMGNSSFANIGWQLIILFLNYFFAMLFHYFLSGDFRVANPMSEVMKPFVRLLFLGCTLMVITMHILPKYPELHFAKWTAGAILVLKFLADWFFGYGIGRRLIPSAEDFLEEEES